MTRDALIDAAVRKVIAHYRRTNGAALLNSAYGPFLAKWLHERVLVNWHAHVALAQYEEAVLKAKKGPPVMKGPYAPAYSKY